MRVSLETLSEHLMRREARFDSEQSNNTFKCRAKAVDSEVDPSSSFALGSLNDAKRCKGDRLNHYSINDEYLLYKGRVWALATGNFCAQVL